MKNDKNYYLGLDIGTDSVGYAATEASDEYRLIKYRGEPVWGVTLFEQASLCDKRRAFRVGRRRIDRRKQRIRLVREIFAQEVRKIDENFYRRITESSLIRSDGAELYCLFNDTGFTDSDYHAKYPTIHHLICDLMTSDAPHDVRLVYIACAYLVAHRGHFLSEVSVDNVATMFDFAPVYKDFLDYCRDYAGEDTYIAPWQQSKETEEAFAETLKQHGVQNRKQLFRDRLFGGKKIPKTIKTDDGGFPFSVEAIITLLSGGKAAISELYQNSEYEEIGSFSLDAKEEDYQAVLLQLGDDGELIRKIESVVRLGCSFRFVRRQALYFRSESRRLRAT